MYCTYTCMYVQYSVHVAFSIVHQFGGGGVGIITVHNETNRARQYVHVVQLCNSLSPLPSLLSLHTCSKSWLP